MCCSSHVPLQTYLIVIPCFPVSPPHHHHRLCTLFSSAGYITCDPATLLPYLTAICLVATMVESLPINEVIDDNLSVPAVAVALSFVLLS